MNNPSCVIVDAVYKMIEPDNGNPFAKPSVYAKVLDVQNGWVKYGLLSSDGKMSFFDNESDKEDIFLRRYELKDTFIKCVMENQ